MRNVAVIFWNIFVNNVFVYIEIWEIFIVFSENFSSLLLSYVIIPAKDQFETIIKP